MEYRFKIDIKGLEFKYESCYNTCMIFKCDEKEEYAKTIILERRNYQLKVSS